MRAPGSDLIMGAVALPLSRVRVLDLTRALSGPFCTMLLGDLGAEVVKVEGAPSGDMIRGWGPFDRGESVYSLSANRNKRSVLLDFRSPQGKDALRRLALSCDVLVENFRPGVMEKLGLGAQSLSADHPALIYCSITAFGPIGPYHAFSGLDQVAQAMSGMMSVTGTAGGEPTRVGLPICDMLAGAFAALGICASLASRASGRDGRRVETSLLESAIAVMSFQAQRYLSLGEVPVPAGNDHPLIWPYGVFQAQDGPIILATANDDHWRRLCQVLGDPELAHRSDLADNSKRRERREEVRQIINTLLSQRSAAEWVVLLAEAGLPGGPVYDMHGVFADEQVRALGMVQEVLHPDLGSLPMTRGPIWIDGRPPDIYSPPPTLGEHTRTELMKAGLTADQADETARQGIGQLATKEAPAPQ